MNSRNQLGWVLLIGLFFVSTIPSCKRLEPAGVYKNDMLLYTADGIIISSYNVVDEFLKWETANRKSISPEITKFADELRDKYKIWQDSALSIRDAYKDNPTNENRTEFLKALDTLSKVGTEIIRLKTTTAINK